MSKVAFVTCRAFPEITEDDALAAAECERLGIQVEGRMWEDKAVPWGSYDAAIVRSTWNYYRRANDFREWVEKIECRRFWNPKAAILWNLDKRYLRELEQKAVPVVPTRWVENGPSLNLEQVAAEMGAAELVVKPPVSADGHRTFRLKRNQWGDPAALAQFRSGDFLMIQPYLESVASEGEYSFVFIGGEFSHCVLKRPAEGEFRVQERHGGTFTTLESPPRAAGELAAKVLKSLGPNLLYARVDLLTTPLGPVVTEVELTEPSLYFKYGKKAPALFAGAIKKILK